MNPLKVYQKGTEKTNFLIKSDGKLNCGELSFLSVNIWKHIAEMSAKDFLELTLKVSINYFSIQCGMFWAGSQISIKNSTQSWNP